MRLLYHEIRSTGSIEEARGHRDSMERQVANGCVAGKGRIINIQFNIIISWVLLCLPITFIHLKQPTGCHKSQYDCYDTLQGTPTSYVVISYSQ